MATESTARSAEPTPSLRLDWLEQRFTETHSPAYAFHAILINRQSGLPPPEWVVRFLREQIDHYLEQGGDVGAEELLALDPGRLNAEPDTA